jgi:hypothetical protein
MEGYNIISAEKVGNVRRYLSSLVQDYVINGYSYSIRYNRHYATVYVLWTEPSGRKRWKEFFQTDGGDYVNMTKNALKPDMMYHIGRLYSIAKELIRDVT